VSGNGVLLRRTEVTTSKGREPIDFIVLPYKLRSDALYIFHDDKFAGHLGVSKTYWALRQRFWWPSQHRDVEEWVASCTACARRKMPPGPPAGNFQPIVSTRPWQILCIDVVGPLTTTKNGNRHIVTMMDHFSGFPFAFAVKRATAEVIARLLLEHVIPLVGCPEQILSDQGAQFSSGLLSALSQFFDTKLIRTSAYHPQTNGMLERFHRPLKDILAKMSNENQRNWDECLPFALLAIQNSRQDSHRFTPAEVALGGQPIRLPIDSALSSTQVSANISKEEYVERAQEIWEDMKALVQHYRQLARSRQLESYAARTEIKEYQPGDLVWLFTPAVKPGLSRKLVNPWIGPFRITARIGPVNYSLMVPGKRRMLEQRVHVQRLKPFVARSLRPWDAPVMEEPDSFAIEQEPEIVEIFEKDEEEIYSDSVDNNGNVRLPPDAHGQGADQPMAPEDRLSPSPVASQAPGASTVSAPSTTDNDVNMEIIDDGNENNRNVVDVDEPVRAASPRVEERTRFTSHMGPDAAEADTDVLFDLRVLIEGIYSAVNDVPDYSIGRAKRQLQDLLGEASHFIRQSARQRMFRDFIRKINNRQALQTFLRDLLDDFHVRFAYEREKLQQKIHQVRQRRVLSRGRL
jgi:transposase InsO family protein